MTGLGFVSRALAGMRVHGVLDWRNSVPDRSPLVEIVTVEGAHMTMGSNPETQRVVAARQASLSTLP